MPHMSSPQPLLDALDAKPLGNDRFEAPSIEYLWPRTFTANDLPLGVGNPQARYIASAQRCRVWTASYGGQKAMIDQPQRF
jgi:hypothetical protein